MGLSNYQLVLLDNLIYLDSCVTDRGTTIKDVVNRLLYKDGDINNGAGTGTIEIDCKNVYQGNDSENCLMSKEEWIQVLQAIEADKTLCSLTIHTVESDKENGFRAMALTGDKVDENVIIFRGTIAAYEWIDNGIGGYSVETPNQVRALNFVQGLDIVNNKTFVTSGHSKGGNLAQYVALHSDNPPIDKCLNFDGQGFSEAAA